MICLYYISGVVLKIGLAHLGPSTIKKNFMHRCLKDGAPTGSSQQMNALRIKDIVTPTGIRGTMLGGGGGD